MSAFNQWLKENRNFRPVDQETLVTMFATCASCAPMGWAYPAETAESLRQDFADAIESRVDYLLLNLGIAIPDWSQKTSDAFHFTSFGHALSNALYNTRAYDLWDVTAATSWLYGGQELSQKAKDNVVQIAKLGKLRMYLKPSWIRGRRTNFMRRSAFQALPVEPATGA